MGGAGVLNDLAFKSVSMSWRPGYIYIYICIHTTSGGACDARSEGDLVGSSLLAALDSGALAGESGGDEGIGEAHPGTSGWPMSACHAPEPL